MHWHEHTGVTDCGNISAPQNGYVTLTSHTDLGSEARFSCKNGFKLIGIITRRCQLNGRWSFYQPSCHSKHIMS